MLFAERSDVQLYSLLSNLSSLIDHTDYNGIAVGYSIIDALKDFSTNVGSKQRRKSSSAKLSSETLEQLKFEEVKSVYKRLDELVSYSIQNGGFAAYNDLKVSVGKDIDLILGEDAKNHASLLFRSIVKNLADEKNYVDNIRLKGINLVETVRRKGSFSRPIDYLNEDYKSIIVSFGDPKR